MHPRNLVNSTDISTEASLTQNVSGEDLAKGSRNRKGRRFKNIAGTASKSVGLAGAPRVVDIYVGGCSLETTSQNIEDFCRKNDVVCRKSEELKTKSEWYKSFKISITSGDRDKVLSPEIWPEGVFVRKFFSSRHGMTKVHD